MGLTLYTAAKAAIVSFARSFSQDLLARNIRVNVLSPGIIDTPVYDKFGLSEEEATQQKIDLAAVAALKRMGKASEIGRVAVFLASEDSSFMLGSEVLADGGLSTCSGGPAGLDSVRYPHYNLLPSVALPRQVKRLKVGFASSRLHSVSSR
nr:SDR family oxidoreductase [Hymenobacter volaticus]